ncbi:conserved domain protein [Bacteroides clarus CAG:160]|uniref:hypothetical protein n=1 Tax=Bacteroides clarus TaxID=626929 RepID=UPI00033C8642|nr:hypothetical protein [Bacteroides clarus]CDB81576.1 conserved domain protein [Bacteroides clarus CAG:160]
MILNAKKRPLIAVALLLTSLGITTSCIDNSYDLNKDIDMTISAGGEHLAIPVGYTEKITLDKIIEIEEGDDLQLVDGEYHLLKKGNIDNATTEIGEVTVTGTTTIIEATPIAEVAAALTHWQTMAASINKTGTIEVSAHDIDDAIKEIGALKASSPTELIINLGITAGENMDFDNITFTDLKITFPSILDFEPYTGLSNNILDLDGLTINKGEEKNISLQVKGYKFGNETPDGKKIIGNTLNINEKVIVEGKTTVDVKMGSSGTISFTPTIELQEMDIQSVTGVIQPIIEPTGSTVNLENLPDFLEDDATELDITNPIFTFIAKNPLEAPIVLNGTMQGEKNGSIIEGSTVILGRNGIDQQDIILEKGDNIIALSRLGTGGPEGSKNIKVSNINDLIKKIPDVVKVDLNPLVEYATYYTVDLTTSYAMESNYDIDIPLNFGSNLKIVYDETIDNFDLDLEDVDIKKAILSINAVNTIPLAMEIKNENVSALDANGNVIKDIDVTVEGTITESKDGKAEVSSTLNINLNETAEGAISKLDGLKLKVTAVPGQATDVQLLSTQWLQLTDMKLKIPNGIKVDLN